ncbi:MAG: transcription regulator LysR family protein [Burkholderiales bacterium]|nr:LysR family transcriptional regulator [Burkholderiaceae bacterium]
MSNVTFRQLKVFAEVARHLSFARAAESMHLTPPAVTMQVKELEDRIGLALFEREGRRVSLTTAGEYFLVYARRLIATLKEADDAMARFKRLETGLLTIGMVSTAKYFVPHLLARFREQHPGVDVRLRVTANREQLARLLQASEVDLAVMGRPPREIAARAEPFAAHPLVFVCPPEHPLLRIGHPPVHALAPYPFIVREADSGTRSVMKAFLEAHQFEPRITMEMSSNETIKQAVIAGMGISFLSLHTIGLEVRSGLLHVLAVEGTPVMRGWNVVHLLSKVLSPAAEAFRYFIIEHAEEFLVAHDTPLLKDVTT